MTNQNELREAIAAVNKMIVEVKLNHPRDIELGVVSELEEAVNTAEVAKEELRKANIHISALWDRIHMLEHALIINRKLK